MRRQTPKRPAAHAARRAAHDIEPVERSMNTDVAYLQPERGCRVFVPPAGFVLHRQSVAAPDAPIGALAGVLVHFDYERRSSGRR